MTTHCVGYGGWYTTLMTDPCFHESLPDANESWSECEHYVYRIRRFPKVKPDQMGGIPAKRTKTPTPPSWEERLIAFIREQAPVSGQVPMYEVQRQLGDKTSSIYRAARRSSKLEIKDGVVFLHEVTA